jgi:LacI family transcriptional regulator, galactose operon repressor
VSHPFRIKDIAAQSGLSEATIDRVLNNRGMVRGDTAEQVQRAIAELERQRAQLQLTGRTFLIDVVVQAPNRFSTGVRQAIEAQQPYLQPAVFRSRFHFRETGTPQEMADLLDRIATRRTDGVILKAPDVSVVRTAVERLSAKKVPVVTLVTDMPAGGAVGYVGIDNRAAGATAAYLLGGWLGSQPGSVLVTVSSSFFRGEEERESGFRSAMRQLHPDRGIVDVTETQGLDEVLGERVRAALEAYPEIVAVYSIGGGNVATLRAFEEVGRPCLAFIAHDLDEDNRVLLQQGRLTAVLHHDLHADVRRAFQFILQSHRALPGRPSTLPSPIQVLTPYNMPIAFLPTV